MNSKELSAYAPGILRLRTSTALGAPLTVHRPSLPPMNSSRKMFQIIRSRFTYYRFPIPLYSPAAFSSDRSSALNLLEMLYIGLILLASSRTFALYQIDERNEPGFLPTKTPLHPGT
jgi:hypothetical protein